MDTIRSERRKLRCCNKTVINIALGIIALILIAGIFFFVGRSSNDSKNNEADTEIVGDENVAKDESTNASTTKTDSLIRASADKKEKEKIIDHQQEIDSLQRMVDSLEQVSNRRVVAPTVPPTGGSNRDSNGQGSLNLGYGTYEGPINNGEAHGLGGTITFTIPYTIDLKNANGDVVEVGPGDQLINVKMNNGRIIQGLLKRADGSQRWIIIG